MSEYPLDERYAYIDKQGFDVLSRYFDISELWVKIRHEKNEDNGGIYMFRWDGWEQFEHMDREELCKLAPFFMTFGPSVFMPKYMEREEAQKEGRPLPEDVKEFSVSKLTEILKEKGIDEDRFLELNKGLVFRRLLHWNMQYLTMLRNQIAIDESDSITRSNMNMYNKTVTNAREEKARIDALNGERPNPCTLEQILSLERMPVCLRYSLEGKLYVLDVEGVLHEFCRIAETGLCKTKEWPLYTEEGLPDFKEIDILTSMTIFPNISVAGGFVFLTNEGNPLRRYNLNGYDGNGKIAPDMINAKPGSRTNVVPYKKDQMSLFEEGKVRYVLHDVLIKDGNVLISFSDAGAYERYIVEVNPQSEAGTNIIYRGDFPRAINMRDPLEDHTLRMDLHRGYLFFPRDTGISLYRGYGEGGMPPKEMIEDLKKKNPLGIERLYDTPITKFSFGSDFMIALAFIKDFDRPLLCLFREKYEQEAQNTDGALVDPHLLPSPDRLDLEYIFPMHNFTGSALRTASISAFGKEFAVMHKDLNQVHVYRVEK